MNKQSVFHIYIILFIVSICFVAFINDTPQKSTKIKKIKKTVVPDEDPTIADEYLFINI